MPEDRAPEDSTPAGPVKKTRKRASAPKPPKPARTPSAKSTPRPRTRKPKVVAVEPAPPAPGLSVLMVASEAHPFAKTGGLAEVTAALSDALIRVGHSVTLVLPRYRGVDTTGADRLQTRLRLGDRLQPVTMHEQWIAERHRLVLVDVPDLFDREALYGTSTGDYPDNAWRFAVFSRAALEYARLKEWRPSIIHAHDWQAGLVPVYQKMQLSDGSVRRPRPGGLHDSQPRVPGCLPGADARAIGLGHEVLDIQAMEFWGSVSYLKGGINFSERSPPSARPTRGRFSTTGAGLRVRGRARTPGGRSGRHPQRDRHRAVDPGNDPYRAGAVQCRRPGRQARREARAARAPSACPQMTRRSSGRVIGMISR